jgi:uncharacterized protein
MKWEGERESENVEDYRGSGGRGGFGGLPIGGRSIGLGTVAVALVAGWIFGINPLTMLGLLSGDGGAPMQTQAPAHKPPADDQMARFVSVVLASTEDVWREQFQKAGRGYSEPKLALFHGVVPTACGHGQSAMGPFYCPGDRKVYIDLDFYETMRARLGAPGDFAQAYVIAHEVGHHVQNLLGISDKVDALRARGSEAQGNALSVRIELQADCFAGVWANHAVQTGFLADVTDDDIADGLNAAAAVGDDRIQQQTQGRVNPETWTHGAAAQRQHWFTVGYQSGKPASCDTSGKL